MNPLFRYFIYFLLIFCSGIAYTQDTAHLKAIINGHGSASEKSIAGLKLSNYFSAGGDYASAVRWAKEGIPFVVKSGNDSLMWQLYAILSDAQDKSGNTVDAIETLEQYLNITSSEGNTQMRAVANNDIGAMYSMLGDYTKEVAYLLKAEKMYESLKMIKEAKEVEVNLAGVYSNTGNYRKAIEMYRPLIAYFQERKDVTHLLQVYNGMLLSYLKLNRPDSAGYYSSLQMEAARSMHDPDGLFKAWNSRSIYYTYTGKNAELKAANDSMLYYAQQSNDLNKQLRVYSQMGMYYATVGGNMLSAKDYFQKALDISIRVENKTAIISNLNNLATACNELGEYAKAFKLMEQAYRLKDSVISEAGLEKIAEMNTRYQTEKKEARIKLLTTETNLQKRTAYFMIAGIGLMAVIGLMLYRTVRIKQKSNTQLREVNTALNAANATKAKLFSIIGHDLRSPISRVYQFLKLEQMKTVIGEAEREKLSVKIQHAAASLMETMEDLLLWSKSQLSAFNTDMQQVALSPAVQQCIDLQQLHLEDKQIRVETAIAGDAMVVTDADFLQVILRNLLQNAIKAAPAASEVNIRYAAGEYRLFIINRGNVFTQQQYEDAIREGEMSKGLAGLGLKLVDELSKKINVKVTFENPNGHMTAACLSFYNQ